MYLVDSLIFHGVINLHFVAKNLKESFCFCFFSYCFWWKRKETCIVRDERQPLGFPLLLKVSLVKRRTWNLFAKS